MNLNGSTGNLCVIIWKYKMKIKEQQLDIACASRTHATSVGEHRTAYQNKGNSNHIISYQTIHLDSLSIAVNDYVIGLKARRSRFSSCFASRNKKKKLSADLLFDNGVDRRFRCEVK